MSFYDALTSGKIPEKKGKKNKVQLGYDEYMEKKELKTAKSDKKVTIIKPKSFEEIEKIIEKLKIGEGSLADLSSADAGISQRMLDFLSGAVFALDGKLERVDGKMFLMTPKGIEISNKL